MVKEYKTILFDIDDTLFDFNKDQKIAFKEAIKEIGYTCTEKMYEDYNRINLNMWESLNQGKIKLEELFIKRFEIFFEKYKINQDEKDFDKILTKMFQKTGTPIKGTIEILDKLKGKYELVIVSNGPKSQQYHRLQNADFLKYFSRIFISEEIGFNKPDIKFFEVVFSNIANKEKSKILLVGDSISSDITGGKIAGIDTCWYNPNNIENKTDIKPNYEIENLEGLLKIV